MSTSRPPLPASGHPRGWLLLAAAAYLVFVVYGSLVPLEFRPRPLAEAVEAFRNIRYLRLGIASRADWVANILLFVPLAFLWLGVLWVPRSRPLQVLASAVVMAGCAALSLAIEFTQLFFPPRTVSLNDLYAESIGAAIGIAAWWLAGPKVTAWFAGWFHTHSPRGAAEHLLYGYLFLLFGYNVLPLDLTISPIELFHKWREGRIHLVPFAADFPSAAQRAYGLLTDVAIWVPAGFLWRASSPLSVAAATARVLVAAIVIELLQLFVYTRVTDVTDVVTAAVGGLLGAALAGLVAPSSRARGAALADRSPGLMPSIWLAGLLGITAVLVAVFWYPFDFRTDWGFVRERVATLRRVPLSTYYYGTEYRAATEVLHKVGFFLPLGAWIAWGTRGVAGRYRLPVLLLHAAGVGLVACVAAAIEAVQLFLPTKHADPTDFVLMTVGGAVGYVGFWWLARASAPGISVSEECGSGAGRGLPNSGAKYPQAGATAASARRTKD